MRLASSARAASFPLLRYRSCRASQGGASGRCPPRRLRGTGAATSALSPDGRWIAYWSAVSGQAEVFVERVGGGDRTQVSTAGGSSPRWARDGHELYFVSGARLMAARFTAGEPPEVGVPVQVATVPDLRGYDVLPGHREFVALQRPPEAG